MTPPAKQLPLDGEVFAVEGCTAFLLPPGPPALGRPRPWVWYAPTLEGLPGPEEGWMFRQFLDAGIAIAGIDVGESYGSPAGRQRYSALYAELTQKRGLASRACLLARSRGGLMLYNWAAEHPESVACLAGIYPVCKLLSYPGLQAACGAYGLSEAELAVQLTQHNPIERLEGLARAGAPLFHLHGDCDTVVPIEHNSAMVADRYRLLGGTMTLRLVEGQGHNYWPGWFECQELVDFVIARAR